MHFSRSRLPSCAAGALALAVLLLGSGAGQAADQTAISRPGPLRVGNFSSGNTADGLPAAWEVLTLPNEDRHTRYTLVKSDGGTRVVKAVSQNAASALIRRIEIDPVEHPVVEWRWKVEGGLENGDATKKSGDDYPARLYLTFDYDVSKLSFMDRVKYRALRALGYDDIPVRGLSYFWASTVPTGEELPSPYSDAVMMLPLRSGVQEAGAWRRERRNVVRDYRRVFGEDPPPINGVVIMTDTDNTGEKVTAYYGDIVFREKSAR